MKAMDYQEPMTLGSPVSHTSPSNPVQQISGNQFLPGYLMGDQSIATTPILNRTSNAGHSHSHYANSPVFGSFSRSSPPSGHFSSGNKSNLTFRSRVRDATSLSGKDKTGAPPVSSLIEENNQMYPSPGLNVTSSGHRGGITDLSGRASSQSETENTATPKLHHNTATSRRLLQLSTRDATPSGRSLVTHSSPAQIDPFYSQGEAITSNIELNETWVTIFGFPPAASSFVLQQFSRCGVILEHHSAPADGNWIHVRFESKLQARKALSKSGKVFPGNLMIGVIPCIDINVSSERNHDETTEQNLDVTVSSCTPGNMSMQSGTPRSGAMKPRSIRPLTAAYNAVSSNSKVTSDVKTPQKSSGIVTKAMDYIFG